MYEQYGLDRVEGHKQSVKAHSDEEGWFPDSILGESMWALSLCERKIKEDGKLYWRFLL